MIALTATATEDTRNVIMKDLCMKNCEQIIINPNKPNVKYSVEVTKEKDERGVPSGAILFAQRNFIEK